MRNKMVETANVKAFAATAGNLERAEAGVPGLALVHGQRGLGKTRTAVWYQARTKSAVYLRSKKIWTPSWLLEELSVELGVTPSKRLKELFEGVVTALRERPRLVCIDEANLPEARCLECIRDLHDVTDNPILLIGHEGIVERLKRMGPFWDRFLYVTEFKPLSQADLETYCRECVEIPVAPDVVREVLGLTGGNFRRSIVALKGLENRARVNGAESIGMDLLRKAA